MQRPNIAVRLLAMLGLDISFNSAAMPNNHEPKAAYQSKRTTRWGRNAQVREKRKQEFKGHGKLARKAHMGEIGLRGPRGYQVRSTNGVLRITR